MTRADDANRVLDQILAGEYEAVGRRFAGMMKQAVPLPMLKSATEQAFKSLGPITQRGEPKLSRQGTAEVVEIPCVCENGAFDFVIAFDGNDIVGMVLRPKGDAVEHPPPRYAQGGSFEERAVTVGSGEWALPGTLTLPRKRKKKKLLPAVVLVHGSGPNDRDETVGGSKVFLDLAWGLAARGVAALRYEKRTRAHSAKITLDVTLEEEVIEDALAAVNVARAQPEVGDVYLAGHSLGGTVAPAIGARDPSIAGIVVLAGLTREIGATILDQMRYVSPEGTDLSEMEKMCARADDPSLSEATDAAELPLGMSARYILSLRANAPERWAATSPQRMLILHGERDYQVTMEDLEVWRRLTSARTDVTVKSYPELNHVFAKGSGKSTPAEYQEPANVDERVVKDIASWIG